MIIASAPISWLNCAADYSRYLPTKTPGKKIVLWVTLGGAIPSVLIAFVGVAASTATNMTNPIGGLQHLLPGWFFGCYLAVIVGGTVTNNFLNTYSSSMSLLTLGLRMKRYKAVFIDATVGTALSVYAIFVSNFINSFVNFLSVNGRDRAYRAKSGQRRAALVRRGRLQSYPVVAAAAYRGLRPPTVRTRSRPENGKNRHIAGGQG